MSETNNKDNFTDVVNIVVSTPQPIPQPVPQTPPPQNQVVINSSNEVVTLGISNE